MLYKSGLGKSSSEHCYTTKVVLFKKPLRNAELISALNYRRMCLKSVDRSIARYKKQLSLFCIALQFGLLVVFRILMFFYGKIKENLNQNLICNFEMSCSTGISMKNVKFSM